MAGLVASASSPLGHSRRGCCSPSRMSRKLLSSYEGEQTSAHSPSPHTGGSGIEKPQPKASLVRDQYGRFRRPAFHAPGIRSYSVGDTGDCCSLGHESLATLGNESRPRQIYTTTSAEGSSCSDSQQLAFPRHGLWKSTPDCRASGSSRRCLARHRPADRAWLAGRACQRGSPGARACSACPSR